MGYLIAVVILIVVFAIFLLIDRRVQEKIKTAFKKISDKKKEKNDDKPVVMTDTMPTVLEDPDTMPYKDNLEFSGNLDSNDDDLDDFLGYQSEDIDEFDNDDDIFSKDFFDNFFGSEGGPVEPLEEENEDDLKKYTAFGNTSLGSTSIVDVDKYDDKENKDDDIGFDSKPTLAEMINDMPKEIKVLLLSDILRRREDEDK